MAHIIKLFSETFFRFIFLIDSSIARPGKFRCTYDPPPVLRVFKLFSRDLF